MRSQRLCELRRFSECRSLPSVVPTGNKKKQAVSLPWIPPQVGPPTALWHLSLARADGILQPSRRPTQNSSPWESGAKNCGTALGGTKDRSGRSVRFPLVRKVRVPASNSEESRRVPGNHHEGALKTGTDRTPIREFISTILLGANRQSG